MIQEQYIRAVQISDRLQELEKVKDDIKQTSKHRLWYASNSGEFGSSWTLCSEWRMRYIRELLDKHDTMIRAEIEEEIGNLLNEIETL